MKKIESFNFPAGRTIARKYLVVSKLGAGWEGEVYRVLESRTGIERAAKLFYPHRNIGGRTSRLYAKRLHRLRHCPLLIQYHTEELIVFRGTPITVLISEYVKGDILSCFLRGMPGNRVTAFMGLHLLYSLAKGIEMVHGANEYHGDIHVDNIIVNRLGLEFELKLVDMFHIQATKAENRRGDICDLIRLFYDALGGAKHYARQPHAVKFIVCGLKRSLILRRFRTISHLCRHLENMEL